MGLEAGQKMVFSSRKIVLLVDNCPAHFEVIALSATKLVFLLSNTTGMRQPHDQGIKEAFKRL